VNSNKKLMAIDSKEKKIVFTRVLHAVRMVHTIQDLEYCNSVSS
jgi:hypothetical protein